MRDAGSRAARGWSDAAADMLPCATCNGRMEFGFEPFCAVHGRRFCDAASDLLAPLFVATRSRVPEEVPAADWSALHQVFRDPPIFVGSQDAAAAVEDENRRLEAGFHAAGSGKSSTFIVADTPAYGGSATCAADIAPSYAARRGAPCIGMSIFEVHRGRWMAFGGGPRTEDVETSEAEKWHYIGQHAQDYPGFDIVRFYEKHARGTLSELVDRPGGAVLVACYAGFNRSCAVVALHLLDRQELSLHDAIATILKGQPYALWGNDDFVKQIVRYAFRCRYAQDRIAQLSKKNGAADAALLLGFKLPAICEDSCVPRTQRKTKSGRRVEILSFVGRMMEQSGSTPEKLSQWFPQKKEKKKKTGTRTVEPRKTSDPALENMSGMFATHTGDAGPAAKRLKLSRETLRKKLIEVRCVLDESSFSYLSRQCGDEEEVVKEGDEWERIKPWVQFPLATITIESTGEEIMSAVLFCWCYRRDAAYACFNKGKTLVPRKYKNPLWMQIIREGHEPYNLLDVDIPIEDDFRRRELVDFVSESMDGGVLLEVTRLNE